MTWEKELIPNEDRIYCFVHKANVDYKNGGKPRAAAFQNTPRDGSNLSSDWSKYSTPEETKNRIGKQFKANSQNFKNPNDYGVLQFEVGFLRQEELRQEIEHDPIFNPMELDGIPNNQSHTIIIGEKDEETRLKMKEMSVWVIEAPPQ